MMYEEFLRSADERIDRVTENILLIQKKNGLTFGTDALLLAAFIRKMPSAVAVDFGAGTGIISFLLTARNKFAHIYAIEAQSEFADLICRNAKLNGVTNRVSVICKDVRDLTFADLSCEADVIFSNPPYMRADSGKKNDVTAKAIARHEVLGGIEDFCKAAAKNLKFGGLFYAVYRPDRLSELLVAMHGVGIEPKRLCAVCPDQDTAPSLILVEGKKGAAPAMVFEKPLLMYQDAAHTVYTDDFAYIYENGCFKEKK